MNEQHPGSGRGSGKRGRPAVGKPEQVRLSETEKALAVSLGNGVLSKGVRTALQMAQTAQDNEAQYAALDALADALSDGQTPKDVTPDAMQKRLKNLLYAEAALKKQVKGLSALSPEDLATAAELGEGNAEKGIAIALSAARFLGTETARKLQHHGSGNTT